MRKRAFVFDDDEVIRKIIESILDDRGYEVLAFSDPGLCPLYRTTTCQCTSEQTCGDIIISDVNMPNVNGLRFVEKQKEMGCKVKHVALMSGGWSDSDLQRAQELGCQVFHKPFTVDEIYRWLDDCEKRIDASRMLANWFREKGGESKKEEVAWR